MTMLGVLVVIWALFLGVGCSMIGGKGRIQVGKNKVISPPNAETASTITETTTHTTIPIPAGTAFSGIPAPDNDPVRENAVTSIYWPKETVLTQHKVTKEASVSPPRKPDATIELKKLELADRRIILYASIACLIAGIVVKAVLPAWPSLPMGLFAAAPLLFLAWKFAEIPWWIAALPVGLVIVLVLGYKRAEWDKNKDGIPDVIQKPKPRTFPDTNPP